MVIRVVADHVNDARLEDIYRIGVDEVSYRKDHRYLTVVADHDRDVAVAWVGEGKSGATLQQFFDQLGPARASRIEAASVDLHGTYAAITCTPPGAKICADPFHVIKLANNALVRSDAGSGTPPAKSPEWSAEPTAASARTAAPTCSSAPGGCC